MKSVKFWKIIIFLALLIWFGVFMAEKINLATADLGRHIKNGEWVVNLGFDLTDKNSPLFENFYSYTYPDFPVVNHHWGAGVIFYWLYKLSGFTGLSIFYILLSAATFSIFFYIACRESNFTIAAVMAVFLIPLMAERREIRPEIWSYLLSGIFFLVLWLWSRRKISWCWLFSLPALVVFWVNLHVYFFLGIFLIGAFLVSEVGEIIFFRLADDEFGEKTQKIKRLIVAMALSILASFINPFGLKGALHPLYIYKNYGYTVLEEKSVWFLENYGIVNSNFILIKAVLILIVFSLILLFIVDRKKASIAYLLFSIFFGAMGWLAIRNFTLLGFFALPVLAYNIENIFLPGNKENSPAKENGLALVYIFVVVFSVYNSYQFLSYHWRDRGIGLAPKVNEAAEFSKQEKISGPIFNNYDIGGYLIFHLWPEQKVFVDNRPETYPSSFFSEVYKPMQENADVFEKFDREYNFNAVVFYRNDITPWGMSFLKSIRENSGWAPVFTDDFAVIYLKRIEKNQSVIEKYQIK